jgi:CRP/FNR family cyclic AMP-dependent transcriptional regulator
MVPLDQLKRIYLLSTLTDPMLEKIQPLPVLKSFEDRETIFKEGQMADLFYMLLHGKVLLEVEASESIMISLGSVKPGYSFGWSALIPGSRYTSYAMSVETCDVIVVDGEEFLELLEEDQTIGYRIMRGIVRILKSRLERRTGQFLKTLRQHPDIKEPFWK